MVVLAVSLLCVKVLAMNFRKMIYLDTASTTPVDKRVFKAMKPYFSSKFGNPASLHSLGAEADQALRVARQQTADFLTAHPDEIYFTSGGTEALNWAVAGLAQTFKTPKHMVISAIEHEALIEPCLHLERQGWKLTLVSPDQRGLVTPEAVASSITTETVLVAVMTANNEIGTVQPIKDIAKAVRAARKKNNSHLPYFLTDACQAPRALDLAVDKMGVDLLVLNGSKIYGPKGVGALYVRRGVEIDPLLFGGGQESGRRSGTSNVPGIVGLGEALAICAREREAETAKLSSLRDFLWTEIKNKIPSAILNGDLDQRLPSNLHLTIPGLIGEQLVIELSARRVACSVGSACSIFGTGGSRTLRAIGLTPQLAESSLRFSLDRRTTKADLKHVVKSLEKIIFKLKSFEPQMVENKIIS